MPLLFFINNQKIVLSISLYIQKITGKKQTEDNIASSQIPYPLQDDYLQCVAGPSGGTYKNILYSNPMLLIDLF